MLDFKRTFEFIKKSKFFDILISDSRQISAVPSLKIIKLLDLMSEILI